MTHRNKWHIGVLGPHDSTEEERSWGHEIGERIAQAEAVLVCGGLGGIMEVAAQGAKEAGGTTIGLLPGPNTSEANPFIDIAVPTDLGAFRNMLVVRACHAVIAVRGAYGTLSEIAFALRLNIPVVGLHTWQVLQDGQVDPGIHVCNTPAEAVTMALALAEDSSR